MRRRVGSRERNEGRGRVGEGEGVRRGRGGEEWGGGGQHGRERGMGRARRRAVSDILVDVCQGWIRHARGFYPRCLARANIACDVEEVLWPAPDQRQDAGAE